MPDKIGLFLMTFEELIKKVESAKNLRHSISDFGATYIRESFVSDKYIFGWVLKHPSKGFEKEERGLAACIASVNSKHIDQDIEFIHLSPSELLIFREELAMRADFYEMNDLRC